MLKVEIEKKSMRMRLLYKKQIKKKSWSQISKKMKINLKLKRRKKKEWVAGGWNWIYKKRIEHVEPVSGSWNCNKFIKIKQKKL